LDVELNEILIKNADNEVYIKQNNYSKEHLSFELNNNNNISKKENKCKILLPNVNMITKSFNNNNNDNKINQLNITENLNNIKNINACNLTKVSVFKNKIIK